MAKKIFCMSYATPRQKEIHEEWASGFGPKPKRKNILQELLVLSKANTRQIAIHEEPMLLSEMTNLPKRLTGLDLVVFASPGEYAGKKLSHGMRIKICRGSKTKEKDMATVVISNKIYAKFAEDFELNAKEFSKLAKWIAINRPLLQKYWDKKISTKEFRAAIKKLDSKE